MFLQLYIAKVPYQKNPDPVEILRIWIRNPAHLTLTPTLFKVYMVKSITGTHVNMIHEKIQTEKSCVTTFDDSAFMYQLSSRLRFRYHRKALMCPVLWIRICSDLELFARS